jgi:hypothetical protein
VTLTPIVSADDYVENFLADDANRDIRYLVIATRNRLPSRHVQPAPYAVTEIDWLDHRHQAERYPRSGEIEPGLCPTAGPYRPMA